jgi:predicted phosphodiesterase
VLLAVLSDIHGNLAALDAVLGELERERVDELVCLGDVALGPEPEETVSRVRALGCGVVMGNWDAWVLEGFPPAQEDPWRRFIEQGKWWARKLSTEDRAFLRTLCHASSSRSTEFPLFASTAHPFRMTR